MAPTMLRERNWSRIQALSSIALAVLTGLTLLVLIRYTFETFKLRKEAENQVAKAQEQVQIAEQHLRAQLMPIVVLDSDGSRLILRNLGAGPALDVGDVRIMIGTEKRFLTHAALIPPSQSISVLGGALTDVTNRVKAAKDLVATAERTVCIRYQGANGIWHQTKQSLDVGETHDLIIKYDGLQDFLNRAEADTACR